MHFNITDSSILDEIGPEKIIYLRNPSVDMKAILQCIIMPFPMP